MLQARGFPLDIRRPACGDRLPETLDGHAGVVIYGGPMSVNDKDAFIAAEIDFVGKVLDAGTPFLGICLGSQMLAKQLGTDVGVHPEGLIEVGYYPIRATEAGRDLFPEAFHVYQWHGEGNGLPAGAVHLAEGETFEVQAFRYGANAYGLQFHPELTQMMMLQWLIRARKRLSQRGAQKPPAHFLGRLRHDGEVKRFLGRFLDRWLADEPR